MHIALVNAIKFIKTTETQNLHHSNALYIYVYNEYPVLNETHDYLFLNKCLKINNNNNQCLNKFC